MQLLAENLCVERGGRAVFAGLGFAVASGEALLLTGPNGAGKTTLLRTIAGFLRPRDGEIRLSGGLEDREVGELAHYIGHANGIKATLSVTENLAFWSAFLGEGDRSAHADRVETALDRFNLSDLEDIPAAYLSAGQKRRLGLARLMVAPRPLWLLDEPTVSLDAGSTALLAAIVAEHLAAGGLALAATHIPLGLDTARELRLSAEGAVA
ncbi:MAG: heme ABC exporter ATP-binding protein CcmA [Hyphomicrobiaceae bacterium]|nr:heme ABC exporter ATP-binding protein CcmA [Hyphomicrobiaceae bacterium]